MVSTAAAQSGISTALRLLGLLDILFSYAFVALAARALYLRPLAPPRDETI